MDRNQLLDTRSSALGASWAQTVLAETRQEGRSIAGGWPGTLPEARALVGLEFHREVGGRALGMLCPSELSTAVSIAYERAKRDWSAAARAARVSERGERAAR